jgi:Family of unknown function (DUF5856)
LIDELITKIFKERNNSHARHWSTNSYAQHQALGEFYESIIETLDKYIEAYIGTFGKIEDIPDDVDNIGQVVRDNLIWLNENRSELSKEVPALENILDELAGLHMTTLFKLENLR